MKKNHLPIFALLAIACALAGCGKQATATDNAPVAEKVTIASAPEGMVYIPTGSFQMGTEDGLPYEGPVHTVSVEAFWMDAREVTNFEFARFVEATGYRTESEKWGWSAVFDQKAGEWKRVDGADWRHPEGPRSDIRKRMNHPVVHVSWNDAAAYSEWAGKRLPTEAEWEWAARGGMTGKTYAWGEEMNPGGKFMANYWQGKWPTGDTAADGFRGLSPVASFPPNGYKLFDMTGNAWEWTADWFSYETYESGEKENPQGPKEGRERVMRGGSFLCNEHFCSGYRVAARNKNTPDSAAVNLGFRCARSIR